MKKLLGIVVPGLLFMNINFAQSEITKKMLGKKYNMGVKKDDATLNLDKTYFRIHVTKEVHQDFFMC